MNSDVTCRAIVRDSVAIPPQIFLASHHRSYAELVRNPKTMARLYAGICIFTYYYMVFLAPKVIMAVIAAFKLPIAFDIDAMTISTIYSDIKGTVNRPGEMLGMAGGSRIRSAVTERATGS